MNEKLEPIKLRPPGWTAREAFACAYCWSGFCDGPEREDTPELYWRALTERKRNEYRSEANKLLFLAIARGQAIPVPPEDSMDSKQLKDLLFALNMKSEWRVRKILHAILTTLKPQTNMTSPSQDTVTVGTFGGVM